jgi:hypothetical protein
VALLKRLRADGQCDPSQDTLATDTGVSSRNMRRATATLYDLGLLRWQTRLIRAEQTSNAYELVPATESPAVSCGGQSVREREGRISRLSPAAIPKAQTSGRDGIGTDNRRCWGMIQARCSTEHSDCSTERSDRPFLPSDRKQGLQWKGLWLLINRWPNLTG